MNNSFFRIPMATVAVLLMNSCSTTEDTLARFPNISGLANTDCLSHVDIDNEFSRSSEATGLFEMTMNGTIAHCKFSSLDYPCDFKKLNVDIIYHENILTIVEYPSSDKADCRCEISATFLIENMPQQDFILRIYHGDTTGNFNPNTPKY